MIARYIQFGMNTSAFTRNASKSSLAAPKQEQQEIVLRCAGQKRFYVAVHNLCVLLACIPVQILSGNSLADCLIAARANLEIFLFFSITDNYENSQASMQSYYRSLCTYCIRIVAIIRDYIRYWVETEHKYDRNFVIPHQ